MRCKVCDNAKLEVLIDLGIQPVAHNYLKSKYDNDIVTHLLKLHYCKKCGFAQINEPIPPEKLYMEYNYCFSAWKPEPHISAELDLLDKYVGNKNVSILEIGCNDGVFFGPLKKRGYKRIVGVEPNGCAAADASKWGIRVLNMLFSEDTVNMIRSEVGGVDIVVLRQVLEHISDLNGFFKAVDQVYDTQGEKMLFLEVPDFSKALESADCSTIWEEHPNYFTTTTLEIMLIRYGYVPIVWDYYNFSGGAICVLAKKMYNTDYKSRMMPVDCSIYKTFAERVFDYREVLVTTLKKAREKGYRIELYGTGSRACTLVNGLCIGDLIDGAIDDQPEKDGLFMPGCRLEIKSFDETMNKYINCRMVILLAVNNESEDMVVNKIHSRRKDILIASLFSPKIIKDQVEMLNKSLQ